MRTRLIALLVIVTGLTLLGIGVEGVPEEPGVEVRSNAEDDAALAPDEAGPGVTWFCPAGRAATPDAAAHQVTVANPTDAEVSGIVSTWRADGSPGPGQAVTVAARSAVVLDAASLSDVDGSFLLELAPGGAVVSHRLLVEGRWDEGPCATRASAEAHFPAVDTRRDATARLALLNPFRSDLVVDVTVSSSEGVRVPTELSGLVVPGGTSALLELGEYVQNRDQFAVSVVARAGRFAAELAQSGGGGESPSGLRLQLGVPSTVQRTAFADGFVSAGLGERYLVYNPSGEPSRVALAVIPYGAPPEQWPEPFLLDVPARRTVAVDLGAEARVPPDSGHWVHLDVLEGAAVVAERLVTVTGDNPAGLSAGTANSTGTPVAARRWVVAGLDPEAGRPTGLALANPSPDAAAAVRLVAMREGAESEAIAEPLEIPAGGGVSVDLGPVLAGLAGAPSLVVVESDRPVVAEWRANLAGGTDLAVVRASPVRGSLADLATFAELLAGVAGP